MNTLTSWGEDSNGTISSSEYLSLAPRRTKSGSGVRVGGAGVGVRVGVGVLVGSGVSVGVGVGVSVGFDVEVRVGVADAVTGEAAVGNTATDVAVEPGPHAVNNKRLNHTTVLPLESRSFIFPPPVHPGTFHPTFRYSQSVHGSIHWLVADFERNAKVLVEKRVPPHLRDTVLLRDSLNGLSDAVKWPFDHAPVVQKEETSL